MSSMTAQSQRKTHHSGATVRSGVDLLYQVLKYNSSCRDVKRTPEGHIEFTHGATTFIIDGVLEKSSK